MSASSVLIRPALETDDRRIGDLLVESFVTTYARKMPEVVVTERRIEDLRQVAPKRRDAAVIVAELAGEVIGTVTLVRPEDRSSRAWTPNTCDLRYMALDPRHQGRGMSALLIQDAIARARGWGAEAICLHIRRGAAGLAKIYERAGFKRTPQGDLDLLPEIFLEAFLLKLM